MSELQTSEDFMRSEAYQHGRTLGRLDVAREALQRIAFAKNVRSLKAARALAKFGLQLSEPNEGSGAINLMQMHGESDADGECPNCANRPHEGPCTRRFQPR